MEGFSNDGLKTSNALIVGEPRFFVHRVDSFVSGEGSGMSTRRWIVHVY
jgi:hypothetical protein